MPDEAPARENEPGAALLPLPDKKPSRPRRERGPRIPEHLPVIEEVIEPVAVQACPEAWRRIGEKISEQLDFEPGGFFRRRIVRPTYVHRSEIDAAPVTAALPESLQERSIAAPGLLAHILVSKYCDHLPLYRQEYIFKIRYQVWLPRQTMARWVGLAADWLKPVYEEIRAGILSGGYVQIDETPVRYLDPGHGKAKQGYFWACCKPGRDAFFHWSTSRSAACLERIVPASFRGTLQCDGYTAYDSFAADCDGRILLAGCMAHARRYFFEAREESPQIAGFILRQMQHLYAVEAELKEARSGPRLRQAARSHQSRPVIVRLRRLFERLKKKKRFLPGSGMGKAIDYALGQWESLCVYLEDGCVEIDNNAVENAIRPTAVGKKNWLFIGEAGAGERSAIIYTVIECCRRRGIDPYAYLRDVLTRLPSMTNRQIKEVTPEAWAKAQAGKKAQAAVAA